MKLAAIDIGSNAVRCQISNVLHFSNRAIFKKLEYIRYPIRFGEDVFNHGYISKPKEEKFLKLMHAFKLLLEVHDVDHYMICATSAMRNAQNASEIINDVREALGMNIQVIDGRSEAEMIGSVLRNVLEDKHYLHIDVGGGSTEFNVYIGKEKVASQSFELGSIRHMQGTDSEEIWQAMKRWVKDHATPIIDSSGNVIKINGVVSDITDIKNAEAKIQSLAYYD
ncbi:MAG: phosphatase, partial [Hymenobacteraceae bacterium]|nr:phosphatase [Hymenobacteraceae bacterium]